MRTTKPIATISFNTAEFLELKLNELLHSGRLSFWAFITHEPEDDEGGKKRHHHVYVEPSKMLQTDDLRTELLEVDPTNEKPLGCLSWNSSKFDPWYMYALHDRRYLASKGQSRRYHYGSDSVRASDTDDLLCKTRCIDLLSLSPYADMLDAIEHEVSWPEYFARGTVPLPQIRAFEMAWNLLAQDYTFRKERAAHAMEAMGIDPVTGELIAID